MLRSLALVCFSAAIAASIAGTARAEAADQVVDLDRMRAEARDLVSNHQYVAAVQSFTRLLVAEENGPGPSDAAVAADLIDLGSVYEKLASYAQGEAAFKRAIRILQTAPGANPFHLAIGQNNLGHLYWLMGRYADAEPLLLESIDLRERIFKNRDDRRLLGPLDNLGLVYLETGRYIESEAQFNRALSIQESNDRRETPDYAITLDNLGYLFWAQGRYQEAERLHRRALAIEERTIPDTEDVAVTLNSLGSVLVDEGYLSEAKPILERAAGIWRKVFGPDHPQLAYALINLAQLNVKEGDLAAAEPLLEQGLAIREKSLGPNNPNTAIALDQFGDLRTRQGNHAVAEPLLRRALDIKQKTLGPQHPEVAKTSALLARALRMQGRLDDALGVARQATAIRRERLPLIAKDRSSGSESEQRSVREDYLLHIQLLYDLSVQQPANKEAIFAESFEVSQLAQSSAVATAATRAGVRIAASDPELTSLLKQRQDAIDAWQAAGRQLLDIMSRPSEQISGAGAGIREDQDRLEERIRDAERQLSSRFPRFAELSLPKPLSASELRRLLDPDEVVISLAVGINHSFLWAWRSGKFYFIALDINAEQLGIEVDALRSSLDPTRNLTLEPFDVKRAFLLYSRTIGKAAAVIDGSKELLFVPDGAFQSLPISVLVTSEPAPSQDAAPDYRKVDWLIRQHAFTVSPSVSSISTLRNPPGQVSANMAFIGIGDPVLKGPPISTGPAGAPKSLANLFRGPLADVEAVSELEPLPETAGELRRLAESQGVGEDHLYLRERASEPTVRAANLVGYRTIAFATHGLVGGELRGLAEPALVLTPPETSSEHNDGLLTATEIAQLTLNADWVILSACNTAAGTTRRAEGLSGLAKSFIYAGAKALLVSHWKVLSDKAVNLSVSTLDARSNDPKISKAEALRQAELLLIDSPSAEAQSLHPLFWAPFVVVGTSRK